MNSCYQRLKQGDLFDSWCGVYKQKEFTAYDVDPKYSEDNRV